MNKKHTWIIIVLLTVLASITLGYTPLLWADSNPPQRFTRMHMTPEEILALTPLPLKERPSSLHGKEGRLVVVWIASQLHDLYGVSSFVEGVSPTAYDGLYNSPLPRSEYKHDVPYIEIPTAEDSSITVHEYLDHITSENTIQWGFVHGQLAIWPTTYPAELENYLDIPISLELDGVSFVDAMVAWTAKTASKRKTGKGILLQVMPLPVFDREGKEVFRGAHPAMLEPGVVSVTLHEVTAREALCAILAQNPVFSSTFYAHSLTDGTPRDRLTIRVRGEMKKELPVIAEEEYWQFWSDIQEETLFESEIPQ